MKWKKECKTLHWLFSSKEILYFNGWSKFIITRFKNITSFLQRFSSSAKSIIRSHKPHIGKKKSTFRDLASTKKISGNSDFYFPYVCYFGSSFLSTVPIFLPCFLSLVVYEEINIIVLGDSVDNILFSFVISLIQIHEILYGNQKGLKFWEHNTITSGHLRPQVIVSWKLWWEACVSSSDPIRTSHFNRLLYMCGHQEDHVAFL